MRLISSLLIALALFVSPIFMASATMPAAGAAMTGGHCPEMAPPAPDRHDPGMALDCLAACSALPAAQPVMAAPPAPLEAAVNAAAIACLAGIGSEQEPPPPR